MTDALKTREVPGYVLVKVYDDVLDRWYGAWVGEYVPFTFWQLFKHWFHTPYMTATEYELDEKLERRAQRILKRLARQQVRAEAKYQSDKRREDAVN